MLIRYLIEIVSGLGEMFGRYNKFGGCWYIDSIKSYNRGWDYKGIVGREEE